MTIVNSKSDIQIRCPAKQGNEIYLIKATKLGLKYHWLLVSIKCSQSPSNINIKRPNGTQDESQHKEGEGSAKIDNKNGNLFR